MSLPLPHRVPKFPPPRRGPLPRPKVRYRTEVAELVEQHQRAFTHRLAEVGAEAGARDPETLARHLALRIDQAMTPARE